MMRDSEGSRPLGRLWRHLVEASEAAVAVHYAAPWMQAEDCCNARR